MLDQKFFDLFYYHFSTSNLTKLLSLMGLLSVRLILPSHDVSVDSLSQYIMHYIIDQLMKFDFTAYASCA